MNARATDCRRSPESDGDEERRRRLRARLDTASREALFFVALAAVFAIAWHCLVVPLEREAVAKENTIERLRAVLDEESADCGRLARRVRAARNDPFFLEAAARDRLKLTGEGEIPAWLSPKAPRARRTQEPDRQDSTVSRQSGAGPR